MYTIWGHALYRHHLALNVSELQPAFKTAELIVKLKMEV
jgi:hypothetical protein